MNDYYEVLYNRCYGGFSFPDDFVEKVFEKYPPETEVGSKLFEKAHCNIFRHDDEIDPSLVTHYIIEGKEPFKNGYSFMILKTIFKDHKFEPEAGKTKYITKDDKTYYYLDNNEHTWREVPEVIAMAKECDILKKKIGYSKLHVAKVPIGYKYHIREYDGMESVDIIIPYKNTIQELLDYIKNQDKTKLSSLTQKLLSEELTIHTLYNKIRDYDASD
jgi:hypothetical protein